MNILSILLALLIFGFLIFIHELGHFIVARLCGVKVLEFAIGMGPKVFSIKSKKSGTAYSLRWIPIGGYGRRREVFLRFGFAVRYFDKREAFESEGMSPNQGTGKKRASCL